MSTGYFLYLDGMFAPLLALPMGLSLTIISALIVLIITSFNRIMVDQQKVKELKEQQKELQRNARKLQKSSPEQYNDELSKSLKLSNEIMKLNFKPLIPTLILAFLFLPWVAEVFKTTMVTLPVELPFFGTQMTWFWWYFFTSIPFSIMFRKALGVA